MAKNHPVVSFEAIKIGFEPMEVYLFPAQWLTAFLLHIMQQKPDVLARSTKR